jgi:hypothetical protein
MSAYRRITRCVIMAAAAVSMGVGLTACHLPFTSADAEGAAVTVGHGPISHELPKAVIETVAEVPGALKDLSEDTEGPIRDAIIGTACDSFAKGDDDPDWEAGVLGNLLQDTQPPEKQLLDSVQNLVATFSEDVQNGITTPDEIWMACQIYLVKGNLG